MMRQVHLLTLFNESFRTSTMITDVLLLLLLLLLLLILLDSCSPPLMEPSSLHELRAVIRLVDYSDG